MYKFARALCSALLLFSLVGPAQAQDLQTDENAAWKRVLDGSAVAIMRHALAPGTGDPIDFSVENCATQRNLSDTGRSQARAIGKLFRANNIDKAKVFSSEWCRCRDTAELLDLGTPEALPVLNSFFADRSTAGTQTAQLREKLANWLTKPSMPALLVTHQVNISALTDRFTRSGEILIITLEQGELNVLASIHTLE